jgi:hypothetical protein
MSYMRTLALAVAAGVALLAACDRDTGPTTPDLAPVAYVRYVHAVVDTGATDWRPVDRLEDSPPWFALAFRGSTPYQAMGTGGRHLRVFPTTTNINLTSRALIDTTITFDEGVYYTLLHVGYARADSTPADFLVVLRDELPVLTDTNQVALRVVNAGVNVGSVDVFETDSASAPLPSSPTFADVAFGEATPYQTLAKGGMVLRVTATGTTTPVLATATAPAGSGGASPVAGSTIGRSVLTAIVVGRSIPGSTAGSFSTPAILFLLDKNPPRP